jgi:hypothetical protein
MPRSATVCGDSGPAAEAVSRPLLDTAARIGATKVRSPDQFADPVPSVSVPASRTSQAAGSDTASKTFLAPELPMDPTPDPAPDFTVGQTVRLVKCRGHVTKADAGRRMTIRRLGAHVAVPDLEVFVDDGAPESDDLRTNGFSLATWLPLAAIEPAEVRTVEVIPADEGAFDRLVAYRQEHGCSLKEAVRATGFVGSLIVRRGPGAEVPR